MDELTSFVNLVKTMRAAQTKYFKSRTQTDLQRSKNLERQVDAQIQKIERAKEGVEQLSFVEDKS